MPNLSLTQISKRYRSGERPAVQDFNLLIEDGEFIVFLGPSGCGKSTLLRMVAGLEEISEGQLLIGGVPMNDTDPKDRNLSMVFQDYALFPHMSVARNIGYGLKVRGVARGEIETRVRRAADQVNLIGYMDRMPGELSGGQRQRVALARAIVRGAPLLLMDEPLSNLDAKMRVQIRQEITSLHDQLGTTTIYVTHDQIEAMTMADRIVIMRDGTIQQIGTPEDIYRNPANSFVASFIGSPPMNLVPMKRHMAKSLSSAQAWIDRLADIAEEEIALGFRPEHVLNTPVNEPAIRLDCVFEAREFLGHERLVSARSHGKALQYREAPNAPIGDTSQIFVPLNDLTLFHPLTGERLS